jgi:hypothetical protein
MLSLKLVLITQPTKSLRLPDQFKLGTAQTATPTHQILSQRFLSVCVRIFGGSVVRSMGGPSRRQE